MDCDFDKFIDPDANAKPGAASGLSSGEITPVIATNKDGAFEVGIGLPGAPKNLNIIAEYQSDVFAHSGACVIAKDGALVTANESSQVKAEGGADVDAYEGSTVTALGVAQSTVDATIAHPSHVDAYPGSNVTVESGAEAVAKYENVSNLNVPGAHIVAGPGGKVYGDYSSINPVKESARTEITAQSDSYVEVADAYVTAEKGSKIDVLGDTGVLAKPGSVVHARGDGTVVIAQKGSNVDVRDGAQVLVLPDSHVKVYSDGKYFTRTGAKVIAVKGSIRMEGDGDFVSTIKHFEDLAHS